MNSKSTDKETNGIKGYVRTEFINDNVEKVNPNIKWDLQIMLGIEFCKKHNLIKAIKEFNIPSEWSDSHVSCLDELFISDSFIGWRTSPDPIVINEEEEYTVSILFDLERIVKSGSCYDLSCYLYQLIMEIKKHY